jgi:hypothetical protein
MSQDKTLGFGIGLPIRGDVYVELRDMRTNTVKRTAIGRNIITTNGAIELAKIIASSTSGTRPRSMGIGSSTTAPAVGQTDLQSSLYKCTGGGISTSRTNNQITYQKTFGTGIGTGTVQEAGLFTASGGTMISRFLTGAFAKASTDSLTVSWRLTFGT